MLLAELISTFVLMLAGPGLLVLGAPTLRDTSAVAVAFGVGLAAWTMIAVVGHISGGHMNPAVTLAMALTGRIDVRSIPSYLIGQIVGATSAGLAIWTIAHNASDASPLGRSWDGAGDTNFGTNLWSGEFMGFWPMLVVEVILSALLVVVYVTQTRRVTNGFVVSAAPVGAVLAAIHLLATPVDNTGVNPVRSAAMALFSGGDSLAQLWAFVVFPVLGAVVGAVIARLLEPPAEATAPRSSASTLRSSSVRESAARAAASVRDTMDD